MLFPTLGAGEAPVSRFDRMHLTDRSDTASVERFAEFALESACRPDLIAKILVAVTLRIEGRPIRQPLSVRVTGLRKLTPIREHRVRERPIDFVGR